MKNNYEKLVENYKQYLIKEEKAALTVDRYVRDITALYAWLMVNSRSNNIACTLCRETVLKYKGFLSERYALTSTNSIISSLNGYFEFIDRSDLRLKYFKSQRRVFLPTDRELTIKDYKRLVEVASTENNPRLSLVIQTVCSTGIRVSELKFITAESIMNETAMIYCKGKQRMVILPTILCKKLKKYCESQKIQSGPIFITKNGNPMNRSNLWSDMKRICTVAGIASAKVFPHNLRHLFARTFYSKSKDIVRLADVLGHSSINTTRIYTMESGEAHKKQIQSLGLVE